MVKYTEKKVNMNSKYSFLQPTNVQSMELHQF